MRDGLSTPAGYVQAERWDATSRTWKPREAGPDGQLIYELESERERRMGEAAAKKARAKDSRAANKAAAIARAVEGGAAPAEAAEAVTRVEEREEFEQAQAAGKAKAARAEEQAGDDDETNPFRQAAILAARRLWREARGDADLNIVLGSLPGCRGGRGADHPRLREYLKVRGIPLEHLPGGRVPPSLRFHGDCLRESGHDGASPPDTCPAILAAFSTAKGEVRGVQRIYLDAGGEPRKAAEAGDGKAKREKGSFKCGGAVRLTKASTVAGILVICEGVETAVAVLASVAEGVAVWSVVSTSGYKKLLLDEVDAGLKVGWIKQVVIAGDLDECKRDGKRPGGEAAAACATRLREQWPHLSIAVMYPNHEIAPKHVDDAGNTTEGKSCDWLDVLRHYGREVVCKALIKGEVANADGLYLPETRTARAQVVLENMFRPDRAASQTWRLRRYAGKWWTYRQNGRPRWVEESAPEEVEAAVGSRLDRYFLIKRGVPKLAALSGGAVKDIMAAMICYTAARAEQMPVWLDGSFDDGGRPQWGETIKFDDAVGDAPIKAERVIAGRNGLMDSLAWCKGQVRIISPSSRWFSRSCLPFDIPVSELESVKYDPDDDADERVLCQRMCPEWLKFLNWTFENDSDSIETLQRWFGYCLTSDTKYQKVLWLQGPPGTGKGTICDVLAEVVGADNVGTSSFNNLAERFDLASLVGRNVIFVPEVQMGRADAAAALEVFKAITGNSPVRVEDKYSQVKNNVRITGKWVVTPNEEPKFSDASAALMRRLVVLVTRRKVERPDEMLGERLCAERVGVLCWALFGLRRLEALRNFIQPAAGQALKDDMKRAMSPVSAFVEDQCALHVGSRVTVDVLYKMYKRWAEESGLGDMGRPAFGAKLRASTPQVDRAEVTVHGVRQYMYLGIRPWLEGEDRSQTPRALTVDRLDESTLAA